MGLTTPAVTGGCNHKPHRGCLLASHIHFPRDFLFSLYMDLRPVQSVLHFLKICEINLTINEKTESVNGGKSDLICHINKPVFVFPDSAVESVSSVQIHLSGWWFWGHTLDLLTSKLMEYPAVWAAEDILSQPVTVQQEVMKHIMWFLQGKGRNLFLLPCMTCLLEEVPKIR